MRARRRRQGLTLVEVMVSVAILSIVLAAMFVAMMTGERGMELSFRSGEHSQDVTWTRDRLMRLLCEAPLVPSPSIAVLPGSTGFPSAATCSPWRVAGAGNDPDELYFYSSVVVDTNGDGVIDNTEGVLGAGGVIGDYYRVHVITDAGQNLLVRDTMSGTTGALRTREVLVHHVDDATTTGTTDEQRSFFVQMSGTPPTNGAYALRIRQGHPVVGGLGREVVRRSMAFYFHARQD